jgi:hypothetical protein
MRGERQDEKDWLRELVNREVGFPEEEKTASVLIPIITHLASH